MTAELALRLATVFIIIPSMVLTVLMIAEVEEARSKRESIKGVWLTCARLWVMWAAIAMVTLAGWELTKFEGPAEPPESIRPVKTGRQD